MEPKTKPQLFKPGQGGRPKGAVNKITREHKERVEWVLELLDEKLEANIEKLKPKEMVELWLSLQEYVRPKLQRVNLEVDQEDKKINKIIFEIVQSGASSNTESEVNSSSDG
jgi:hypothetical protein